MNPFITPMVRLILNACEMGNNFLNYHGFATKSYMALCWLHTYTAINIAVYYIFEVPYSNRVGDFGFFFYNMNSDLKFE